MDPSDVDSADDVRAGWDGWNYSERLAALDSLANSTLALYGYDDVDVASGEDPDNHTGYYEDDEIVVDPEVLANPDPEQAIHVTDHETVHAMDDQDGIEDSSYEDDDDFDFTEEDLESFSHHQEVGDTARALDHDGVSSDGGGGGGGGG